MYKHFFKPLLDFLVALLCLPFFILLLIPIGIAIKIDDRGPIFYCGKRLGKNGKPFRMYKFRSMKVNAPDLRLADGSTYNGEDDPRVTKVGKFLRKTSLDEIPQILNILFFQMSVIGPRPDTLDSYEKYTDEEKTALTVAPGLTGYNQAYFRNSISSKEKLTNDVNYVKTMSLFNDIKIFFKTIVSVVKKDNVFHEDEQISKKVFIVGASILQLPAIKTAKEMGMQVAVADYNPQAIGIEYADRYYNCSTIDEQGLLEAVREYNPDGIMTTATDMPMRAIAYVCEQVGLRGIDRQCALNCTDKTEMIRRFKICGVPAPKFWEIPDRESLERIMGEFTYPCIMKPSDNSGSRGVYLVHNAIEALENYEYTHSASRNGCILVEEYMEGREISVETFVCDGHATVLQITDKLTTGAPHFVETGHSQPSTLSDEVQIQVKEIAQKACDAVGLLNGPAHIEMIVTENGPKMVEMGARMGGDCITSHLVPLSTGIDMIGASIRQCVGEDIDLNPKFRKASAIVFLSAEKEGVLKEINGVEQALKTEGVHTVEFFKQIGDAVGSVKSSADRVGYVIAQADTPKQALEICNNAAEKIRVITE